MGMKKLAAFLFLFLLPGILWSAPSPEARSPLVLVPQKTKLAKLYCAMLDRDIEYGLKAMLDPAVSHASFLPEELACAMAYAYTFPESKFFQQEATLRSLRKVCATFQANLKSSPSPYHLAQRLEPLIRGYLVVRDRYPTAEQRAIEASLRGGLAELSKQPLQEANHRGMLSCAVLALGTELTGDAHFREQALALFASIRSIFAANGEVLEDGVPDLAGSAHSLQSLFLLRCITGDAATDALLIEGLQWYTRLFTTAGVPVLHNRCHPQESGSKRIAPVLGLLSFYAEKVPALGERAGHGLEHLMQATPDFILPRGGFYFLLGVQHHQEITSNAEESSFCQLYARPDAHYLLVQKNYQTAVLLRGGYPYKGMQVWAYAMDAPLIFPYPQQPSQALGMGFDTSCMDVQEASDGYEYRLLSLPGGADLLIVRQGPLFTGYVFTQDATVVVMHNDSPQGMRKTWVRSLAMCGELAQMNKESIVSARSKAKMMPGMLTPERYDYEGYAKIHLNEPGSSLWTTFCGPETISLIRHLVDAVYFVHIQEPSKTWNVVINLADRPFEKSMVFPGTDIPVPALPAYGAAVVKVQ